MRAITRGAEPQALRQFISDNQTSPQNLHYDNTGGKEKGPMLEQLVRSQHGLCAYTMRRMVHADGHFDAHIEHILPRTTHPDQSLDWGNLLACFPRTGDCEFGAKPKDAYDPATQPFVRPDRTVDGHFRFRQNGEVEGLTDAALACLAPQVLNLNAKVLVNDRKAKIQAALTLRPSAAEARRRAHALRQQNAQGWLEPYCEAVAQVLEKHAERADNAAKRRSGARRT
jgi:uncharacterized protein (TIGR02646 family)